jgi:hypothetical protein
MIYAGLTVNGIKMASLQPNCAGLVSTAVTLLTNRLKSSDAASTAISAADPARAPNCEPFLDRAYIAE